ncbi:MAG: NAD(P)H-hydrate dehydratase, partial [Candidatus Cloacimonetes bacterium]|nr:NAD(P)H-hydrate dehydratase [Candidatus Cloacimonadota bacterium]
ELSQIFEIVLREVMTKSIPETDGKPDIANFLSMLEKYDVVLFGPGLGVTDYTAGILEELLVKLPQKLIIDADGLNILAKTPHLLNQLAYRDILLTPHVGEFSRLSGLSIDTIEMDTMKALADFIKKYKTKVLLKSAVTIYADEAHHYFNTTGNDGLSTGGSGDVLAGIIVSFVGQGLPLEHAGISASWLLGITAEKLALEKGTPAITPTDVIARLFS